MRIILAVTFLALASRLEAQGRTYSVLYGRNISQGDLVKAIQDCDKRVLRPPCAELTRKASEMFSGAGKTSLDLANYVSTLEGRKCPSNARVTTAAWVPAKELGQSQGRLAVFDQDSGCHATETLLWDKDENKPVISLYDGNLIASYKVTTAQQVATAPAETLQAGTARAPLDTPVMRPTTTSAQRIPVVKPQQPALRPVPSRRDTVFLVRVDTMKIERSDSTVIEIRDRHKGFPWKTAIGTAAGLGILTGVACAMDWLDCSGDSNTNTNTNINGMAAMRRGMTLIRF